MLDGALTRDAAIELDARRNVTFAKRQRTWFRREPGLAIVDATGDARTPVFEALDGFLRALGDQPASGRGAGILLPP